MKLLALNNIVALRDTHPGVYEDLVKMQQHINVITAQLGGIVDPIAAGGISVTGTNGIIDVQIIDKNPQVGEDYFVEYGQIISFSDAHTVPLGPARNYRTGNLAGLTTYWRWYKSTKLGGLSNRVVFGDPPTAVTPGNLSTVSPGPAPSPSQGSGQSQIPGYGYGRITNNIPGGPARASSL